MNIPDSQIAVTLYNLREFCKTESDLDSTLDKLCEIGYQAVQVSGVPLEPAVIKKQLDKHNLYCCATHDSLAMINEDTQKLIDKMHTLECDFVALGAPPIDYVQNKDKFAELINIFNEKGAELLAEGIKLGYHNHHFEFAHLEPHKPTLELFYERTNPKCVFSELDVHWVQRGGANPETWIRKLDGRIPVIHFKDFAIVDRNAVYCEIGEGNLEWDKIIQACRDTNVRWYSIEQDEPFPGRDIFESVKISFNNLKAMGVK